MLNKKLWILVGLLAVSIFILVGCEQQAKSGAKGVQAAPKASVAGEAKTTCHAKVADANAVKTCPMKAKKTCPMKGKKPSGASMAAKPCEKMTCALGDGKAANKNICCEHKGKKYCFCCEGCKKQFEKDPEKYISKCKAPDVNAPAPKK
ncbi:MAG: YHS domain-containing protein [Sedimentisphaerales bacterium]